MLSLVWLSQVIRLIDLKFSLSTQIFDVLSTTILVLPSFIGTIINFILLISLLYLNFYLNSSGQNFIINQYLDFKNKIAILTIYKLTLIIIFFISLEIISPKLYEMYKLKELDIRNNLKLGLPSSKEFHIENELSIFYNFADNSFFSDVEALIYKDNQFIKSESAYIEMDKLGFNIIFINGVRIKMNNLEKSKTTFEKFTYNIIKENLQELLLDKEHFNTIQLLKNTEKDFKNYGHSRIVQYLIFISLILLSNNIIFKNHDRNSKDYKKVILFINLIFLYLLNSYLLYELNGGNITIYTFYIINIFGLLGLLYLYVLRYYDSK